MVVWQYLHSERQLMVAVLEKELLFGLSSLTGLYSNTDYREAPAHHLHVLKEQKWTLGLLEKSYSHHLFYASSLGADWGTISRTESVKREREGRGRCSWWPRMGDEIVCYSGVSKRSSLHAHTALFRRSFFITDTTDLRIQKTTGNVGRIYEWAHKMAT